MGSNPTEDMDVGLHLFCVGSGLATGWSLVQGVLPTLRLRNRSETKLFTDALCPSERNKNEEHVFTLHFGDLTKFGWQFIHKHEEKLLVTRNLAALRTPLKKFPMNVTCVIVFVTSVFSWKCIQQI
jgi:hypothetical protein